MSEYQFLKPGNFIKVYLGRKTPMGSKIKEFCEVTNIEDNGGFAMILTLRTPSGSEFRMNVNPWAPVSRYSRKYVTSKRR